MRIAIAHWQGRVSPVFDYSDSLLLVDCENGREAGRTDVRLVSRDPFGRAGEMSGFKPDVLVCGALSHTLETALLGAGVSVLGFIRGDVETVLSALLSGQLTGPAFLMPGCRGQQGTNRFRYRGGRRRGQH